MAKVLRWTERFLGVRLPAGAWRGQPFRARTDHAACEAVADIHRLRSAWAFRLQAVDSEDRRVSWNLEAVVDHPHGRSPQLSVRIYFETPHDSAALTESAPDIPSFVRDIARHHGLSSGPAQLTDSLTWVGTQSELRFLLATLSDPQRRFTSLLLLETPGQHIEHIDPSALAESMVGIMRVFVLPRRCAAALSNALRQDIAADEVVVRIYPPGCLIDSEPLGQAQVDASQLNSEKDGLLVRRWIENYAAAATLDEFRLGAEVASFAQVRRLLRRRSRRDDPRRANPLQAAPADVRIRTPDAHPSPAAVPIGADNVAPEAPQDRPAEKAAARPDGKSKGWLFLLTDRRRRMERLKADLAERDGAIELLSKQLRESEEQAEAIGRERDEARHALDAVQRRLFELALTTDRLQHRLAELGEETANP